MHGRLFIGLNADRHLARKGAPAYSVIAADYYRQIHAAGGIPIIVPPLDRAQDVQRVLDMLQGFVMIGGPDLDPRRDGFMLHPAARLMDATRELFDRMLMRLIAERRLPFFGIGVGMQLLNVSQGGNLLLHIPEDVPDAIPHRDPTDPGHRHRLEVVPGSLLARVYGDGETRVSSRHHMAADQVAPGFAVTARSPDGIIEAIESVRPEWFAFGTQFHPEAAPGGALDACLFDEFLEGVARWAAHDKMNRSAA